MQVLDPLPPRHHPHHHYHQRTHTHTHTCPCRCVCAITVTFPLLAAFAFTLHADVAIITVASHKKTSSASGPHSPVPLLWRIAHLSTSPSLALSLPECRCWLWLSVILSQIRVWCPALSVPRGRRSGVGVREGLSARFDCHHTRPLTVPPLPCILSRPPPPPQPLSLPQLPFLVGLADAACIV